MDSKCIIRNLITSLLLLFTLTFFILDIQIVFSRPNSESPGNSLTNYTFSYKRITEIEGKFYPWKAEGSWVILVGHPESLWIGKKGDDSPNYIELPPSRRAILWTGVINPDLMTHKEGLMGLAFSTSPIYSLYTESITAQSYWEKSAAEWFLAGLDVGMILISIGTVGGASFRGVKESMKWGLKLKNIKNVKVKEALKSVWNKIKTFASNAKDKLKSIRISRAGIKKGIKTVIKKGTGVVILKGGEALITRKTIIKWLEAGIKNGFNFSYFAFIDTDHPCELMARETYKSNNWEHTISNKWEKFTSDWIVHIPGLEEKFKVFFRSAGPRYTLLYSLNKKVSSTLIINYNQDNINFWGKDIELISRTTLNPFRDDKKFIEGLASITEEINKEYGIMISPSVMIDAFYNLPVKLPNSYFNELNNNGILKVIRNKEKIGELPAKLLDEIVLQRGTDYKTHDPGGREKYWLLTFAGWIGGGFAAYAGVALALAATGPAGILIGIGLFAIGVGGIGAGFQEYKAAQESWEVNNMVFIPSSKDVLKVSLGEKIKDRAYFICERLYSIFGSLGTSVSVSDIDKKCIDFSNNVKNSIKSIINSIDNQFLHPLFSAFKINLTGIKESLDKETLPLTLDWYYYFPANTVYIPKVKNGVIYITCLDDMNCLNKYYASKEVKETKKEIKREKEESEIIEIPDLPEELNLWPTP